MKRYKLKREIPTFSLGDEFILKEGIGLQHVLDGCDGAIIYTEATIEKFPNILTDWFEEIKPAEPLIKDEKIRKAVRAWAEANNFLDEIEVHSLTAGTRFSIGHYDIEFLGYFIYDLESNKTYTIEELCGEEER